MLFRKVLDWFEDGDLVPLAVVISVAHYGPVLVAHGEHWAVAWAVGIVVDLLHFRSVRYAFSTRAWMAVGVAALTTVIALGYHLRFYGGDWLLALPIPIGIGILAWHASEKERGAIGNEVAAVRQELAGLESDLQARESELAGLESKLQARESELAGLESKLQDETSRRKQAEMKLSRLTMGMHLVNPLAQDVLHLVMTGEGTQAEIAAKHGTSESAVSRLKASLNGGGHS